MNYKLIAEELKNITKTKNEDIQGIVLVHIPSYYGITRTESLLKLKAKNKEKEDYGLHYVFDDTKDSVYQLVDKQYKVDFLSGKATYISKALFSQNPNGKVLYLYTHIAKDNQYEKTEEKLIRFIVALLREYKLTAKDVWRGFDLDGNDYSPLHLLDKNIFEKYITEIEKFIPPVKSTLEGVNGNPNKFIEVVCTGAVAAHKKYSILPSLTMAQAALESGWGKSAIGNNLFGIKAFDDWKGKKKKVWTTEYDSNGNSYKIEAWFRDYDSVDESLEDHAKVLSTSRYQKVREAKNYKEATQAVKDCGYATDPNYPKLLNQIIEQYNLYNYDASTYALSIDEATSKTNTTIDDDKIEIESPFKEAAKKANKTIDEYIHDIYIEHKDNPKAYAAKFSPWDKDRADTKGDNPSGEIVTRTTPFDNTLTYKISQSAPIGTCDCEKAVDYIEAVETPCETLVEPIYPDLVTPPGGEVHIADGFSETKVQSNSNTPLTAEEFEKRQKTFDFSQFKNIKKETTGRPVNPEDAFPVDDQIKKLEEHYPKVKIDKTTFNFKDDNHKNSEIGNAMAKNLAMTYDMVNEVAKRTEQRLVKIENNLSTVMRNLFRMSSRVNINCVYYGGQSIYGKYKCIRCLDDHRVNDGAIVTIDQCLNCTRYEPILGQVYAILDETGSNIVQVMDDMQMSYMELKDYKSLNTISGYYEGPVNAQVDTIPAETPKQFIEDKWKDDEEEESTNTGNEDSKEISEESTTEQVKVNGFKMDWNPVKLETQQPNVNEYDIEALKAEKKAVSSDRQEIDKTIFKDTREEAVEYESFEFDIADYEFEDFGDESSSSSSSDGSFGMGATEVRQKIVDYALKAVEMCNQGIAFYSQSNRYNHMENAINGKHYWDCSSLVQRAYEAAGISGIGTYTANQYPHCLDSNGGLLIPIKDVDQALPGDMVWFYKPPFPTTKEGLQTINYGNTSTLHHIAIYIGNNQYAHASTSKSFPNIKISTLGGYSHEMCFGRVKALIDLDKAASQGSTGSGSWSKEAQGITDELWNASKVADSNVSGMLANMEKYGYKEVLKEVSKAKGFDPYFIAAIIAIETTGNPLCGGNYPGIMQSSSGYPSSTLSGIKDNIEKGCNDILNKASWLKRKGWTESNMPLLATAHNCGQYGTTDALGHSNETRPRVAIPMMGKVYDLNKVTVQEASSVIAEYTATYQKSWSKEEKRTYACKVLRAYNLLLNQKALS